MHALPWRPSNSDGLGRGVGLALLAHAALLVALKFGLDWRTQTEEPAFEAELWATVPRAAAPPLEVPPPPPPEPTTSPAPPPPAPDPQVLQAQREAEIRLEKERERQARERAEQLRQEKARKEREAKLKEERLQAEKAEKAKREKAQQEKARAEQAKADKARDAQRQQQLADAQRDKLRQEQLRRIQGLAGGTGGPQATGTAEVSAGPSASYAGRVMARVRPNIRPPKDFPRELVTDVLVRAMPDGTIVSATIRRSSGNPEWDEWALRAVLATASLPRDTNGTAPKEIVIGIRPND